MPPPSSDSPVLSRSPSTTRFRAPNARCPNQPDSSVGTGYTDDRTIVSQMTRQSCHPEVSYSMHIFDAIALKCKALRRAKVMITHMGFHAMVSGRPGQGRAAQLVNPLRAHSLFDGSGIASGGAKPQVAACNERATRRSGACAPGSHLPAAARPGPPAGPSATRDSRGAEADGRVHRHEPAWPELCAPGYVLPGSRPAAESAPRGPARGGRGAGLAGAENAGTGPAGWSPRAAARGREHPLILPATSQFPVIQPALPSHRGASIVHSVNARPSIPAMPRTCIAQFTHHGVVGVSR